MKIAPNSKFAYSAEAATSAAKAGQIPNSTAGFFIIEAMAAISVLVVGFLGIVALLSQSIGFNRVVSDNYTGNYLAMEGIEVVKNLIDANSIQKSGWNCGFPAGGNFEVSYDSLPWGGQCPGFALKNIGSPASLDLLLFDASANLYNYSSGQATRFKRLIHITILDASTTQVNSIVSWTGRAGAFSVNLEDVFRNWKP